MSLASVAASIDAHNRRIVEHQTWGHLAPKPQTIYPGFILFTHGCYGDITVIQSEFEGLDDSPWYYRALHDYVGDFIVPPRQNTTKMAGGIWRFDGTCRMFKNGRIKFSGKIKPMRTSYRFGARR
jgi:hypothetical protein